MDLAKKRRQYRYEIKKSLNLKEGDTVESVVNRALTTPVFDAEDFEMQVDTWLSSADKVFSFIYLFCRRNPHINITKFIGESVEVQDKSWPKRISSHSGIEEHCTGCTRNGTYNR
jgi:hypothetical protein